VPKISISIIIVLISTVVILETIPGYPIIVTTIYFLFSVNDFKILIIYIFLLFLRIIKKFPILLGDRNIKSFLIILILIFTIRNFRNISIFISSLV
jgi:hypothetical protein